MSSSGRRATSVAELIALSRGFMTARGRAQGLAFVPEASDVIISTYPKCGTTWMQQIVHGLRSGGSMDFVEITQVVPWLELMPDMGLEPAAPQVAMPRAYKSHLNYDDVPKGARYLNAIRDPADVLMSMYRFFDGWRIERGTISVRDFALQFFINRPASARYWNHLLSWWPQRHREELLLLCYEDMLEDPRSVVMRIAQLMSLPCTGAVFERALQQSSFAFMKTHEHQFDDHLVRAARDAVCGLPAQGHSSSKVMNGTTGQGRDALDDTVLTALNDIWRDEITPITGLQSYAAMRATLRAEMAPRVAVEG